MPGPEAVAILHASPVFAGLPAAELWTLVAASREERFGPREYVFREGDAALWFCLVVSGRVKILRHSPGGKEVVLEVLGPGEPVGAVAVLERRPYPASAQVMEPSTILKISQSAAIAP
jgi:CRP-like cAMP-binding protein